MAKAIYICARGSLAPGIAGRLKAIGAALGPQEGDVAAPMVRCQGSTAFAVINPGDLTDVRGSSLLMGQLFGKPQAWEEPEGGAPDGSFALFRQGRDLLEVVCDPGGSRTIWYYFDDRQFVASTSQQAIIMYLGSFHFDARVIPWILSTTGLGPETGWDRRIRRIPVDASVVVDRRAWTAEERRRSVEFRPREASDRDHFRRLRECIFDAFSTIDIDLPRWGLSLSGGYDSRAILAIFHSLGRDLRGLETVTWGTGDQNQVRGSDAEVAARVAAHYGVRHRYHRLDGHDVDAREVVDRFLRYGEGRVDHIAGYLDGFALWRKLSSHRWRGMIRGDEGFGLKVTAITSPQTVRLSVKLALCSDFTNLRDYRSFGIPAQELPEELRLGCRESLSTWRDRLFHSYKLPVIVAALGDLKAPFLDQINPLLSRPILEAMRGLPDHLRDEKVLFRRVIDEVGPPITIARTVPGMRTREVLQAAELMEVIEEELRGTHARVVLPPAFVDRALRDFLAVRDFAERRSGLGMVLRFHQGLRRVGSQWTPRGVKNQLAGRAIPHHLDVTVVAWRLALISKMTRHLAALARRGAAQAAQAAQAASHAPPAPTGPPSSASTTLR